MKTAVRLVFLGAVLSTGLLAADPRGLYDICDYGAKPDGVTINTTAINQAVAAAAAQGGGTVYFPPGRYLSGSIYLQSNVALHLSTGAVLIGSSDLADYPENPPPTPTDTPEFRRVLHVYPQQLEFGRFSLINAIGQRNVAVEGGGMIDGTGDHPNFSKEALVAGGLSREQAHFRRPYGLSFIRCSNVRVRGITLRNLAFWTQGYLDCEGVLVDGVTVDSPAEGRNNDGIDIDGSRRVRVVNCDFNTGDDSICLKASYRDCEDIVISNIVCSSRANGIKMGTASNGGFRNIAIANVTMKRVAAAGLALEVVDGGVMDGITVSNVSMHEVGAAIFIRLGDRGRQWMKPETHVVGSLRNVSIQNVLAHVFTPYDGRPLASSISGLPGHPVENIALSNVRIINLRDQPREATAQLADTEIPEAARDYPEYSMFGSLPAHGLFVRHARGVRLDRIEAGFTQTDHRSALFCDDVQDLSVTHWRSRVLPDSEPVLRLRNVTVATLLSLVAPAGTATYLRVEGASADIVLQASDLTSAREPVSLAPHLPPSCVRP